MFDDPKRELQRLQEELLAAGQEEEVWEEDEDPEEALDEMKELLRREDWEEQGREPLSQRYGSDDEMPQQTYVDVDNRPRTRKKQKVSPGLTLAIILEAAALLTGIIWWLLSRR